MTAPPDFTFPKRVGFHVPYCWDEPASVACTLADYVSGADAEVSFLGDGANEPGVHAVWDSKVRQVSRKLKFDAWLQACSHVVWFDVQPDRLKASIAAGKHNILCLLWQRAAVDLGKYLEQFNYVLCPSAASHRVTSKALGPFKLMSALYDVYGGAPWPKRVPDGQKRLFCPLDSYTVKLAGASLLHSLQLLLDADPDVCLTIAYGKNWSREGLAVLARLVTRYQDRVQVARKPSSRARGELYASHDLTADLSLRPNTGMFSLESLSHGRPVVTFASAPMPEIVDNNKTGWLVPCETRYNWLRAPEVVVNYADLYATLQQASEEASAIQPSVVHVWREQRERRRKVFLQCLYAALDLNSG